MMFILKHYELILILVYLQFGTELKLIKDPGWVSILKLEKKNPVNLPVINSVTGLLR